MCNRVRASVRECEVVSEKLYDLYRVRVNPKTGEPTGQEFKVGGDKWVPMSHQQACIVKSKFTDYPTQRIELREVDQQPVKDA